MTDLEIVKRALTFIGEPEATSMADTARGARRAITAYPLCRDEVLRMVPWTCALKRDRLYDCALQATPWTAGHYYGVGERCTNDTNKTYQCIAEGKAASAGGPTGTGSSITDGACTWTYKEASSSSTNWCHWPLTAYGLGELVTWDTGKVYQCIQAGTTAAANPPIGTAPDIVDGTVRWSYYATIGANRTLFIYQYLMPTDCLRVVKVPNLAAVSEKDQGVQYLVEGKFIYCDQEDSFLRYVYRADPMEWDALLQGTVALRIAAEIAMDITGKESMMKMCFESLNAQYAGARIVAMGETQEGTEERVRWEEV